MQKEKIIILSTVFVDVIGFGIVIPIMPYYVATFGVGAVMTTLLFTAFAACSFFSSSFLGALSDKIGRRPVLITSIISTAIGWTVFASATSVPFLFLGRIIDGCAAGNFTTAQSYLVDISKNEKERTANLGLVGATFGIGFILGPMLGGILSQVSHSFPFWFAGGLAATNAVSAFFFLPESNKVRQKKAIVFNPLRPLIRAAKDKVLRPYYGTWFLFALAFVTGQSVFSLFASYVFGFSAFAAGMVFTAMGVIMTINQTVLLKRVWKKYFSNAALELSMLVTMAVGLALMGTGWLVLFFVGISLNALSQSVLRVVITSEVAGHAPPHAKGETMGILASIMSAAMAIAPVISGWMFQLHHTAPFILGAVYMVLAFMIAFPHRRELAAKLEEATEAEVHVPGEL